MTGTLGQSQILSTVNKQVRLIAMGLEWGRWSMKEYHFKVRACNCIRQKSTLVIIKKRVLE
jgi:hypothetical protein